MMEAGILDHLLVLLLIVLLPVRGMREYDRLVGRLGSGQSNARVQAYKRTLSWQWGMLAVLLVVWMFAGRSFLDLGLRFAGGWVAWLGWILALALALLLLLQTKMVLRNPSGLTALRAQLADVRDLIPHDAGEMRLFGALSLTAGICEELLFRGFLLLYFESLLGIWLAVVVSSVIFGLGHAYQGGRGIFKTAGVGLVMAILVVLTGGVWAPMLVHAAIDLNSGYLGWRALHGWSPSAEAA